MASSFYNHDRRAGELVNITLASGQVVQAYANVSVPAAVDAAGASYPAGTSLFARATGDLQVKNGPGLLHSVTVSPTGAVTAGVLTIYNSLTETGTVLYSVALPATTFTPFTVSFDAVMSTGIFVGFDGTLAGVQVTASYR